MADHPPINRESLQRKIELLEEDLVTSRRYGRLEQQANINFALFYAYSLNGDWAKSVDFLEDTFDLSIRKIGENFAQAALDAVKVINTLKELIDKSDLIDIGDSDLIATQFWEYSRGLLDIFSTTFDRFQENLEVKDVASLSRSTRVRSLMLVTEKKESSRSVESDFYSEKENLSVQKVSQYDPEDAEMFVEEIQAYSETEVPQEQQQELIEKISRQNAYDSAPVAINELKRVAANLNDPEQVEIIEQSLTELSQLEHADEIGTESIEALNEIIESIPLDDPVYGDEVDNLKKIQTLAKASKRSGGGSSGSGAR